MRTHFGIGLFAVLTALLAGAAIGSLLGLSAGEGLYLTALTLAAMGWLIGRHSRRRENHR
jgi:hypothetical protein